MKNKLMRLTSKLAAAAMVASMFASVLPAQADYGLAMVKDTLTREKISASADHVLTFNASGSVTYWANAATITFAYPDFTLASSAPTCSVGTGTCTAAVATNLVTVTCTAGGGCRGVALLGAFTGTNPGTPGAYTVTVGGTSEYGTPVLVPGPGVTTKFQIPIVDDDQVTINAYIESTMAFDIDTTLGIDMAWTDGQTVGQHHETAAPYTVNLGTLSATSIKDSGNGQANYIYLDLSHNATGGAVVTMTSANGALQSNSVPADRIASTFGTMATPGFEQYSVCIADSEVTAGGAFKQEVAYGLAGAGGLNSGCEYGVAVTDMGQVITSPQNLLYSDDTLFQGVARLIVAANISTVTPAHPDYSDTLTFIATATF